MSRLIDADALIEAMTDVYRKHYAGDVSASGFTIAMEMVRKQPTAYDIEKVVAELEESMNDAKNLWDDDEYYTGCANAFEQAIDIVRKGGVE